MKIISYINKLFPKPPVGSDEKDKLLKKRIIKRYATGSVALSLGRYITGKAVEKRRDKITSHRF